MEAVVLVSGGLLAGNGSCNTNLEVLQLTRLHDLDCHASCPLLLYAARRSR